MKVPLVHIHALGEFTPWAKNILKTLEEESLIHVDWEQNSVSNFCSMPALNGKPSIVAIENRPNIRNEIEKICTSGKSTYVIWLGKTFTTEDLLYAIKMRIYAVIDSAQTDQNKMVEMIQRLSLSADSDRNFTHLMRGMKSTVLMMEAELSEVPMLKELKMAVSKLESFGVNNEFNHLNLQSHENSSEGGFVRNQSLGEAITLMSDFGRTGTLWVKSKLQNFEGQVDFLQGRILNANAGGVVGIKAINRMFVWQNPTFIFNRKDPREISTDKPLNVDVMYVVKSGEMIKERYDKIKTEIPPNSFRLKVAPKEVEKDLILSAQDFSTLSSVVEFGVVEKIVDFNPMNDIEIYESLITLRKNKVIQRAA